jgi:hypothetical protein
MATHLASPAVPTEPMYLTLCGSEANEVSTSIKVRHYDESVLTGSPIGSKTYWFPTCNECLDKLCRHCSCSYFSHVDGKCLFMETTYASSGPP